MRDRWLRILLGFLKILVVAAASMAMAVAQGGPPNENGPAQKERFAFLVGVDHYQDSSIDTLHGPGNDVALIQKLLISRYQFLGDESLPPQQRHIVTLIGAQATRKAISDGFRSQLIENARKHPGAVVVFYFSGHGSLRRDSSGRFGGQSHMTIVPSDRSESVLDIADDEINGWFDELRKYTQEITFVLDSCHSGSATRAIDANLVPKEAPPQKTALQAGAPVSKAAAIRGEGVVDNGFINPNDVYASIYSSLRYELSNEADLPDGNGGVKRYGVLTYYLVKTLELDPYISYDEAVNHRVSDMINRSYGQHPEVEGNMGRPVFGAEGEWEDPFLKITSGPAPDKTFSINGGESLGIQNGAFLAIYKASAKKLVGEKDRLATARVTKAQGFTASAQLIGTVEGPIPSDSKVVVVTPNFGSLQLRVDLQAAKAPGLSATERSFISNLTARLQDSPLVTLVDAAASSGNKQARDLQLRRGCTDAAGRLQTDSAAVAGGGAAQCVSPAYYITTPARNEPVFGFWTAPGPNAPGTIAMVLEDYIKQTNLRALTNAHTNLGGQVKISLVQVNVSKADGHKTITSEEDVKASGTIHMHVKQEFRVKVENTSTQRLDVVVFALGTSGSVTILNRRGLGEEVKDGTSWQTDRVFIFGLPLGTETYKVIAYAHPNDGEESPNFRTLELRGASKASGRDLSNPLGWLVNQAGTGRKDPVANIDLPDWTVAQMDVEIDP
jgi:hypothetical protein